MAILNAMWWFFAGVGALVCLGVVLIVLSLCWASFKQRRQERRERRIDLKTSLDRRTNDLLTKHMNLETDVRGIDLRLRELERAEARKQAPQPEAKKCSSKRKN